MEDKISPTYYKQGKVEVWDFVNEQGLDFFGGNVIKYLCRYKRKNGLEDLMKAKRYLDKLIEVEQSKIEVK